MTTRIDAQGARRSITVPTRLQRAPSARLDLSPATEDKAETLYVHPAAKVVSFAAASNSVRSPSSVEKRQAQNAEGTLPWASRSERVVAVGMSASHIFLAVARPNTTRSVTTLSITRFRLFSALWKPSSLTSSKNAMLVCRWCLEVRLAVAECHLSD